MKPSDTVRTIGVDPPTGIKCIGLFTADAMSQCIAEIKEVEGEAARTGKPPKFS